MHDLGLETSWLALVRLRHRDLWSGVGLGDAFDFTGAFMNYGERIMSSATCTMDMGMKT